MDMDVSPIPKGIIMLWYSSIASIPAGWVLCNGANGTPDLRNKYIAGAGLAKDPGDTGGSTSHTHNVNINHEHVIGEGTDIGIGAGYEAACIIDDPPVVSGVGYNEPPYHALAYIMKV